MIQALDRAVALDRRQDDIAHLGQHAIVRPPALADEVQKGLMLRRHAGRCRDGGERLDALALDRH